MTDQTPSDNPAPSDDPAAIDVYWRPGCGFCAALDRSLRRLGIPMRRVDIWAEPDGAAFVREHAGGNETVPTVAVGGVVMVNPTPDQVVAAMAAETPHLLPEGVEAPEPSRAGRLLGRMLGES